MNSELTMGRLRELLDYDAARGVFSWTTTRGKTSAGSVAGTTRRDGYIQICIDGRLYLAHRLAWMYVHGAWPNAALDHVNRVKPDNRISNLREASKSQNAQNTSLRSTNTSGVKGVYWCARECRWIANIRLNGKQKHIGSYNTVEEAAEARRCAEIQLHTHRAEAA